MIERPGVDAVLRRARGAFESSFGRPPRFAACAPGRVNLIGEHTDYNNGFVLPIAIDRVCVCVGDSAEEPEQSRVQASDIGGAVAFDIRAGLIPGAGIEVVRGGSAAWASYIVGVMEQYRRAFSAESSPFSLPNLDLVVCGDVPAGSGLSSSAALEVAVATAIEAMTGRWESGAGQAALARALLCQRAEHEFAGVPCGIMDQFASVSGIEGHALLLDCASLTAEAIPLPPDDSDLGAAILIANTNVRHSLAAGEYAARRDACHRAAAKLGVPSLRDAAPWGFNHPLLTEEESTCARHVITEIDRVRGAATTLLAGWRSGDWPAALAGVGALMSASHASLRDDFRVSCAELDTLVDLAMEVRGVYGARMTGAGFGGCIVALVKPSRARALAARLEDGYPRRHGRPCTVFTTRASSGARPLNLD